LIAKLVKETQPIIQERRYVDNFLPHQQDFFADSLDAIRAELAETEDDDDPGTMVKVYRLLMPF